MQSKRKYKIVLVESDDVTIETMTLENLLSPIAAGDYEYKYALDEITDSILDLKVYDKMTFQFNRDNPQSLGIILRIS